MKITWGKHTNNIDYPDPTHHHITKEIHMTKKQKTLIARMGRTLGATAIGLVAAWLSGPEGLELVGNAQAQSFVVMVVVPTLITLDKMLRYGADEGEE
jgi:hypothetical protein